MLKATCRRYSSASDKFRHVLRQLTLLRNVYRNAIDSKLRGCDIVKMQVRDVAQGGKAASRATVLQQKTAQPVKFELTEQTREAVEAWIGKKQLVGADHLFPSRITRSPHISARQYARIVKS